jgi:hypothetical protein
MTGTPSTAANLRGLQLISILSRFESRGLHEFTDRPMRLGYWSSQALLASFD